MDHLKEFSVCSLCNALGVSRSLFYRRKRLPDASGVRKKHMVPRRLVEDEELSILQVLNSERFYDMAPGEIYATLLDEDTYLCSERTMYRILERNGQVVQRRQTAPRAYAAPELLATCPNELWSWDITKLKGPYKWTYYYLYKIMDIFSRYVVGWMVAYRELDSLAKELLADSCLKQEIRPGQLTVHADRGPSMTSNTVGQLLADLGITKTHSRPHVSNDNPYSESCFKTLKYRPSFPGYFLYIEAAREFCRTFFTWYNTEHRHSGIAMLTPEMVHYHTADMVLDQRQCVLEQAYIDHPERFVNGLPQVKKPEPMVWINKPINNDVKEQKVSLITC